MCDMVDQKKVLITGATGFIGSCLIRLARAEFSFYCLARNPPSLQLDRAKWIPIDLTGLELGNLPRDIDIIVHLASADEKKGDAKQDVITVNMGSTVKLLEWGEEIGIQLFLYASTGGVYGYGPAHFAEDSKLSPGDLYSAIKLSAEFAVKEFQNSFPSVIIRYFFPYGPEQKNRLIPRLIQKIRTRQKIRIYNGGKNPRVNPIFIADAVEATSLCLDLNKSQIINIAGSEVLTIEEISNELGRRLGISPIFERVVDEKIIDLLGDITRMKTILAFSPKVSFTDGITQTVSQLAQVPSN